MLGTPAEEGAGAKVTMVERGVFAGVSAALMAHPARLNTHGRHVALTVYGEEVFIRLTLSENICSAPTSGYNVLCVPFYIHSFVVHSFCLPSLLRSLICLSSCLSLCLIFDSHAIQCESM